MTTNDRLQELIDAAHGVLPYLRASTDPLDARREISQLAERRRIHSAGDRLRLEAEEADAKDAAILRFREALVSFAASEGGPVKG